MARCFMGYLTRLAGDRANADTARSLLAGLHASVRDGAGTPWERDHVTALGLWLDDDFYLDLCNSAELLIRLETAGCDVGDRWQPLG